MLKQLVMRMQWKEMFQKLKIEYMLHLLKKHYQRLEKRNITQIRKEQD